MPHNLKDLAGFLFVLVLAATLPSARAAMGDEKIEVKGYLEFVRNEGIRLRAAEIIPETREAWLERKESVREGLERSWGGFPSDPCPLTPRILGTLNRTGYRVEKIVFQMRPGVWMTSNAYVPDSPGRHPGVVAVHGHWRGAKQDPVVQARCIGLVKLGFFVLAVDAFGSGERGVGKALGEYHGEMTAATLLPTGLPLSGLQVYENKRAVDYLVSRAEVDPEAIGITGASGGGNQSMYAGAYDERIKAIVPVCSVGTYQDYLGAGCCLCELVPGALRYTEEWGVLGLAAPRGLMVVNATHDAVQFSVMAAEKSVAKSRRIYELFGEPGHLKHAVFESSHDYNVAMREAMYGWMSLHLKKVGQGEPIREPVLDIEDPETLRCYPGETRPNDFMTIPRFAANEARRLLKAQRAPGSIEEWKGDRARRVEALAERVLGGFPKTTTLGWREEKKEGPTRLIHFAPEPGLELTAYVEPGTDKGSSVAILLDLEGGEKARGSLMAGAIRGEGWSLVTLDLRATGRLAVTADKIGQALDHNSAEWGMWIGRPLLGQWTNDVRRLLDVLELSERVRSSEIKVIGIGGAGVVALCAGAVDSRISKVAALESLASFVADTPYVDQRVGLMAPGMLRDVGDVAQIAALIAPRKVIIVGGRSGDGKTLEFTGLKAIFQPTSRVFQLTKAEGMLSILETAKVDEIIANLR